MDRSDFSQMNDSQFESVRKMAGIFGMEALQSLVVSTPAEQLERVNAFDAYEQGLIEHVRENLQAPAAEANPPHPKPIRLKAKPYEGKEGENLHFWVREVELAMDAALISTEQLRVAFALSNLSGRAKSWVYTREATSPGCFTSWAQLCEQLRAAFLPANYEYCQCSRFLSCELHEYDQEIRELTASLVGNPLSEHIKMTAFMDGLRVGPTRTQLFRVQPSTLEEAIQVAHQEEYSHCQGRTPASACKDNGTVSVRLADGKVVTVPNVQVDLAVKFEDFDSLEQLTVLDMDPYDMVLGMPWLERHEPWIDWRGKAIGASRPAKSDRALVSHVNTSVRTRGARKGCQGTKAFDRCLGVVDVYDDSEDVLMVAAPRGGAGQVGNLGPQAGNLVPQTAAAVTNTANSVFRAGNRVPLTVAQTLTEEEGVERASCVVLPTTKFDMSQDLDHAAFLHLTRIEWEALHHLAAVSGEAVVTSLLRSATPDEQRVAAQEFMERELADANRRVSTPSRISTNDVVKLETSTYSGAGGDRLPLNRWF
ncbi:hypothetical protein PInf_019227 [Phytophthora infestans]|nr:hypothetical protein PInf_019227 [Phytophthora infestans]